LKRTKQLFDLYIHSGIHVALAVASFAGITFIHFDSAIELPLLLFAALCTIFGYNLTRIRNLYDLKRNIRNHFQTAVILLSGGGALWLAFDMPIEVVILAVSGGVFTLLYNGLFTSDRFLLREVTGIKIFLIALVWSGVTVLMPVLFIAKATIAEVLILFFQRFLFVMALTIPFDIRDVRTDDYQLATLPQVLGIKRARILGLLLITLVLFSELLFWPHTGNQTVVILLISVITVIAILNTRVRQHRYFAAFWVEGIPILWFLLLLVC
jgi:hypothetical protein